MKRSNLCKLAPVVLALAMMAGARESALAASGGQTACQFSPSTHCQNIGLNAWTAASNGFNEGGLCGFNFMSNTQCGVPSSNGGANE